MPNAGDGLMPQPTINGDIHSLGPDAVMIERDESLLPPDQSPIKTLLRAKNELSGVKLIAGPANGKGREPVHSPRRLRDTHNSTDGVYRIGTKKIMRRCKSRDRSWMVAPFQFSRPSLRELRACRRHRVQLLHCWVGPYHQVRRSRSRGIASVDSQA
jgi:hypothetical protein